MRLFLTVPWVGLQCGRPIVAFHGHAHLLVEKNEQTPCFNNNNFGNA